MPAVTSTSEEEQNDADQKMWSALKKYIIKERQRKKEGILPLYQLLYFSILIKRVFIFHLTEYRRNLMLFCFIYQNMKPRWKKKDLGKRRKLGNDKM